MRKRLITLAFVVCLGLSACSSSRTKSNYTYTTNTQTTKGTKSNSREGLCQYKSADGSQTCSNKATRGKLCEKHFNQLNDTYNDLVGN